MDDLEQQWKDGFHTTSKGAVIQLTDMSTPQLQNTINKYQALGYDTTPLEAELTNRNAN